jgi:hypothetical protein
MPQELTHEKCVRTPHQMRIGTKIRFQICDNYVVIQLLTFYIILCSFFICLFI